MAAEGTTIPRRSSVRRPLLLRCGGWYESGASWGPYLDPQPAGGAYPQAAS